MHTHSPAQVHLHQAMIWGWKVSQAICWHPPPSLPAAPTTTSSSVYKYTTLWVFSRAASSNRYSWGESVTVTAWETQKRRKKKKKPCKVTRLACCLHMYVSLRVTTVMKGITGNEDADLSALSRQTSQKVFSNISCHCSLKKNQPSTACIVRLD